jgi:hypothetical protein
MKNKKLGIPARLHLLLNPRGFAAFTIVIACLIAYYDLLSHGFMIDDVQFIAPEQFLPSLSLTYYLFHTPSMHFSPGYYIVNLLAFDLTNNNPWALHAVNIVLHSLCAFLFYYFAGLISSRPGVPLMAALVFLLLPVNAFTVNYIPANTVFLCSIWMLLCLICFSRYGRSGNRQWLPASYMFSFLGLLHFEAALLLPVYIWGILWLVERKPFKALAQDLAPYMLIVGAYLFIWSKTASVHAPVAGKLAAHGVGLFDYLAGFGRLTVWYVQKLFFADGVVYIYNIPVSASATATAYVLIVAAAMIGCLWLFTARKNVVSFSLLWATSGFLMAFAAMAAHINAMGFVIEPHWLYFNSMGFCLLFAFGLMGTGRFLSKNSLMLTVCCVLAYLLVMTKYINALSHHEERYYEYWLRASPGNAIARENLASLYIWDKDASVDAQLLGEMRFQAQKYAAEGNAGNASALLKRIID